MKCKIQFFLQLVSVMERNWLMFIISNHCGIKYLCNLIQLEPCNVMFKVISYTMAHCVILTQWHIGMIC